MCLLIPSRATFGKYYGLAVCYIAPISVTNSEYRASAMSSPELESSSPRQVASGSKSYLPLDILFLIWDYLKRDKSSL